MLIVEKFLIPGFSWAIFFRNYRITGLIAKSIFLNDDAEEDVCADLRIPGH